MFVHPFPCPSHLLVGHALWFAVEDKPDSYPPDGFVVVERVVKEDPIPSIIIGKEVIPILPDLVCREAQGALIKASV